VKDQKKNWCWGSE